MKEGQEVIDFCTEALDFERLLANHSCSQDSFLLELAYEEKEDDLQELVWLLDNCEEKCEFLWGNFSSNTFEKDLCKLFKERIRMLYKEISCLKNKIHTDSYTHFYELKYKIRTLMKQLAGIMTSSDWVSPAIYREGGWTEKGKFQQEEDTYMRMRGSEYVKKLEKNFLFEYYDINPSFEKKTIGFLTSSGMKAIEVALLAWRMISKENGLPIYYQDGLYFEAATLVKSIEPKAQVLTTEEIYYKLDRGEEIGCLIVDPGSTWPIRNGVNLEVLVQKLSTHKQKAPLFLIIDRTVTSIANQLFQKYGHKMPNNIVFISVESGLKYFQFGLDLSNMGFIAISSNLIRIPAILDLFEHLLNVLSANPDPTLMLYLPPFSREKLQKRLVRMGRNTTILYKLFSDSNEFKNISKVYTSISKRQKYQLNNQDWIGTLLYLQLHHLNSKEEYYNFSRKLITSSPLDLCLFSGSSFGFDTMRLCLVEEMNSSKENVALRFSVGRDPIDEFLKKIQYFQQFLKLKGVE
ncbi:hypothetical protein [Bacillus thuringiensis]|uniref:hypothetical protein n=1 Tax=Bacillus thuringiensis TaxID=1428 RepID=UPI000A3B7609|nr:hypothetical protein [Bacillus thuringiensis]OUA56156.1 hypothetical protein BK781_20060 [Bacillus thuringiensis serovar aizawai]